jgi:hypothetical protein
LATRPDFSTFWAKAPKFAFAAFLCALAAVGVVETGLAEGDLVVGIAVLGFVLAPFGFLVDALRLGIAWNQFGGVHERASEPKTYWFFVVVYALMTGFLVWITAPLMLRKLGL